MMKDFNPGDEITGDSLMGDSDNPAKVTGEFVRRFGMKGSTELLIETHLGVRHVIDGNTARLAKPTQRMLLRQLVAHLDKFEELDHVGDVSPNFGRLRVQLYESSGITAIEAVLPWFKSIGATTIKAGKSGETWHLTGAGHVIGELPIEVVAIAEAAEAAALTEVFGDVKEKTAIPVDELVRYQRPESVITDANLAETEHRSKTPLPDEQDPAVTS